jgi:hypothetical protein
VVVVVAVAMAIVVILVRFDLTMAISMLQYRSGMSELRT